MGAEPERSFPATEGTTAMDRVPMESRRFSEILSASVAPCVDVLAKRAMLQPQNNHYRRAMQ